MFKCEECKTVSLIWIPHPLVFFRLNGAAKFATVLLVMGLDQDRIEEVKRIPNLDLSLDLPIDELRVSLRKIALVKPLKLK